MRSSRVRANTNSGVLGWLRAVGFASIAVGSIGLMQSFFWPSIAFFYAGLIVLVIDLRMEALSLISKILAGSLILGVGITLLFAVVLRRSPLQVDYVITAAQGVDLVVRNGSASDDYRDVDLILGTDSNNAAFYDFRNLTEFPGITVVEPDWRLRSKGETVVLYDDPAGKKWVVLQRQLRIRCSLLPKQSSAHILVKIVATGKSGPRIPATDWHLITVKGEFAGRFRTVGVSLAVPRK